MNAASTRDCPVDGCPGKHPTRMLMCKRHWYMVPVDLRREVRAAAKTAFLGEGDFNGDAYTEWRELRDQAIAAVEEKEAGS